jgi:hypothetical protein
MAKLKSGTRIYGTATIDTSVVVGSAVTLSSSGIQVSGISTLNNANATQLQVTGVSTFTNGPVLVGTATSTGTASQPLQVSGGAYVSGNLGIGTTNPQATLQVGTGITMYGSTGIVSAVSYRGDGSQLTGVSGGVTVTDDTATNATRYVLFNDITSGTITGINVSSSKLRFNPSSGTLSATVFTSLSDQTQKTNVRPVTNAIELVNQMRGVYYDWIDNHNKGSVGVIAQEMEQILPQVVTKDPNGLKSVSYGNIVGVLIEAIKEQQIRIEELEKKINA